MDRGGNGYGDEGADETEQAATDQGGDNGQARADLHRVPHHPWVQQIVLDESVHDIKNPGGNAYGEPFGEGDEGDHDPGNSRTDHGDEVQEGHQKESRSA